MPATPISISTNVSSLDQKIVADLCGGNFLIDLSPSVWITTGYNNVHGASIKIINPVGVIIKNYPTSGYDIYPPMTSVDTVAIPLIASNYQYGTYEITVRLTDADNTLYYNTKYVNICPPDSVNATRKYGCVDMSIKGNCRTGKVIFLLQNPPNYKGTTFTSQANTLTVKYPTASGKTDFTTTIGSFSLLLYEGQYQVSGMVCVLYNYGDSVYFKVNYKVKREKVIKCIIDECCLFEKLEELNLQSQADCTQVEKDATASLIINALWLKELADLAINCGGDPSDFITQLESLLGCRCTCNCDSGTPIIGTDASNDWIYRALLTQSSTNAPTAVEDSANAVTVTYAYTSPGIYRGTIIGLTTDFTENSFFVLTKAVGQNTVEVSYNSGTTFDIKTGTSGVATNGILTDFAIQIGYIG